MRWNYVLKNGKQLRNAILEKDTNRILMELSKSYDEIKEHFSYDEFIECDCAYHSEMVKELINEDNPIPEHTLQYQIGKLFQICDMLVVNVPK